MKKGNIIWLVIIVLCLGSKVEIYAQGLNKFDTTGHTELGLNFTQLVSHFIPLNVKTVRDGPIGYSYKRYGSNNIAFRFGFGAKISFATDENDLFMAMRIGYERRKHLFKNFYMTRGWDIMGFVGSLNLPNQNNVNEEDGSLGLGPFLGIEYHIHNSLIISTESMLYVGISAFEGPLISIIPPTSIFLFFRF